ncbi:LacI family DNA-binding transcriptional regulator [Xylophilus sp. ASV27]|uniref:LacI family DNA-binding transcriptional regulator n=1 Tax=Xylophilus sp. ASV27 TaxID=2795129 RepID=UPI0018EC02AF|nr:LacI family DNA-binding transcriptional regulator [Xylophilus sp. ASV27]
MSIQAVAARAGVSVATVSRAFNLPDKVSPATRQRVERAARELHYLPNASARTLRTQRSRVLGVVLPTLLNPAFAECLQGIARAAVAGGYAIIPVTTAYRLDEEERAVQLLLAGNVDGLILVVSNPSTSAALPRLQAAGVPYVLAYNRHAGHPCVSVDGQGAVADAVARLVLLGHRRIAMVSGTLAASDRAQQRYRGYLRGMADTGLDAQPLIEVPFVETAIEALCAQLRARPRPSALVCSNDLLAIRSIRAAHLCGLAVPQDLSVVGFDGIALGEDLTPALSTITQPNSDIGRHGVELLIQAIAEGRTLRSDASLLLAHAFRDGESCAPACEDGDAATC